MADPITRTRTSETPGMEARPESISGLIKDVRDQTTLLLRQEVALAKTEFSEKMSRILRNGAYLISGGLAAFAGFIFILHSLSAGIGEGLSSAGLRDQAPWLAPLIVGLVVIIGSSFCITKGASTIKKESLVPEKTLGSLKEDKEWMQNKVS